MLVVVVHSIHVHAASVVYHERESAGMSDLVVGAPLLTTGEFLDHAGAVAA
jgi:hypothetical protein